MVGGIPCAVVHHGLCDQHGSRERAWRRKRHRDKALQGPAVVGEVAHDDILDGMHVERKHVGARNSSRVDSLRDHQRGDVMPRIECGHPRCLGVPQ
jgi:hypothetical protein